MTGQQAVSSGQSSDGLVVRWGEWLQGAIRTLPSPLDGFSNGTRVQWISGAPLSELPATGTLFYQSIGHASTFKLVGEDVASLQGAGQLRSSFSLNLADGAMRFQIGVKTPAQVGEVLFSNIPVSYDRRANLFNIKDARAGSFVLQASGQLYGVQGSHAGVGFVINNDQTRQPQDLTKVQGVIGYQRGQP
jgi:hypothetical protein